MKRLALLFVTASLAAAQAPQTQYPPSQYPPGQYPPGQYPPSQVPPGQIPARLPGGVTLPLPVPEIKIPTRKPKEKENDDARRSPEGSGGLVMALHQIEGALRQLGDKDLVLDSKEKGLLRFRLLTKTRFRDTKGEAIRDSLLKPGDRLKVEASADDEETALRITLLRKGTPAERTAAEQPFDSAAVKTPEGLEKGEAMATVESASASPGAAPSPSTGNSSPGDWRTAPDRVPPVGAPGSQPSRPRVRASATPNSNEDETVAAAREAALAYADTLPNFVVEQATTRSAGNPAQWQKLDVVTAEVTSVNGKEEYRNISINGRPAPAPPESTGAWTTGEFVTTLIDVLSPLTNAAFRKRSEQRIGSSLVAIYDFKVKAENSHWRIVHNGEFYTPAYDGEIWIDVETARVLRIGQRAARIPGGFPFRLAECVLEYDHVRIGETPFLMPSRGDNVICPLGTSPCSRNEIAFRNYRKFTADSNITFQKFVGSAQ
ncbi:MAG TPA: hypothetical protein DEH78_03820 [Solibacterales bacterium]|nr:hypothetical protein [Bryobacterales bacterium]